MPGALNVAGLTLHRVAHAGGEGLGQVLAQQLLDQIERIEKRAVDQDTPAAQREKLARR